MDRKEVKKERIKRYFLDAAKEIIRTEGVANLTTKKIGDKAAYSCASIYNYFENFNELVCLCLEEMAAECAGTVRLQVTADAAGDRILEFARGMIEANASDPFTYSPFLSTDIDYGFFFRRDGHHFVHPAYPLLLEEVSGLPAIRSLQPDSAAKKARTTADILTCVFHAKLHFYLRYNTPPSIAELQNEIESECRCILEGL
jgi:AcrR family transcriptional regulator